MVEVDSELLDLLPQYLKRRSADVSRIQTYLKEQQFEEISQLAHKIKGTGTGYGLPELTELAKELGSAADEKNENLILAILESIDKLIKSRELEISGA